LQVICYLEFVFCIDKVAVSDLLHTAV
jgi:hypothetical protein